MHIPDLRHSSERVGGLVFFGRSLDKIRLHAAGKLPADYNRGTGFDEILCKFLNVPYAGLVERALQGGTDEELLQWCFSEGRHPSEDEIEMFNHYLSKYGWRDESSADLEKVKRKRGFANRSEIQTWFDFHRADEAEA